MVRQEERLAKELADNDPAEHALKAITEKGLVELKLVFKPGLYEMAVLDAIQKATVHAPCMYTRMLACGAHPFMHLCVRPRAYACVRVFVCVWL